MPVEHHFATLAEAADALADAIADDLRRAIAARGTATLVASGGRTPRVLYPRLRDADLDWRRVWITLSDERWVPPAGPGSNESLVRETLLLARAREARFVGLWRACAAAEAPPRIARALASLPRPFDVVYLGIGEDGHFASLFPGDGTAIAATGTVIATTAPIAPHQRVSLTADALLAARRIVLLLAGSAKHAVFEQAKTPGSAVDLPARLLLRRTAPPLEAYIAETE